MPWAGWNAMGWEHLARLDPQEIVDSLDAFGLLCGSLRLIFGVNGLYLPVEGNNLIDKVNIDVSSWRVGIVNEFRFDFGVNPGIIKRVPYLIAQFFGLLARSTCHVLC